jgi:riboflavin synthase
MFTGLVEATGEIVSCQSSSAGTVVELYHPIIIPTLKQGDSLAINGVCLTITDIQDNIAKMQIVLETLRVTTFSKLKIGQHVNLERSLLADGRFGGHFVLGHVDTTSEIVRIVADGIARTCYFSCQEKHLPYLVAKGQVAVDGISLTIVDVTQDMFSITFIPHTQAVTIAGSYQVSNIVNVEFDILAKYASRNLECKDYVLDTDRTFTVRGDLS